MGGLAGSPLRNLTTVLVFVATVVVAATAAYMHAGWSFSDAVYMVLLTVYTVGYGEVHRIDTPYLHAVTIATMILGCTGMILVTGALVQVLTVLQIEQILGSKNLTKEIDKLKGHVIICGFGRIGVMLARDLAAGGADFIVLERNEARFNQARDLGYLCLQGDATDETALVAAGVERARIVATVLPDDAANVFITLTARNLNRGLQIIARGEAPSTESKLLMAGADKVVLPTHIGAERIAEMILFPEIARFVRSSERMQEFEKVLRDLGLELEVLVAHDGSAAVGASIEELEKRGTGAFLVIQLERRGGETVSRPDRATVIAPGDGLVVVGRPGAELAAIFSAPAARPRAGRTTF
jgi:voltage-gated potassium channel